MIAMLVAATVVGCGSPSAPTATTTEELGHPVGSDPCRVECHVEFDDCNESCMNDSYEGYCKCLCSGQLVICIGECNGGHRGPLPFCPPPNQP